VPGIELHPITGRRGGFRSPVLRTDLGQPFCLHGCVLSGSMLGTLEWLSGRLVVGWVARFGPAFAMQEGDALDAFAMPAVTNRGDSPRFVVGAPLFTTWTAAAARPFST